MNFEDFVKQIPYVLEYFVIHNIKKKIESNKNTIEKRDLLVDDFYHILIPSQIEAKSIIEQVQEVQEKDKKHYTPIAVSSRA